VFVLSDQARWVCPALAAGPAVTAMSRDRATGGDRSRAEAAVVNPPLPQIRLPASTAATLTNPAAGSGLSSCPQAPIFSRTVTCP